MIRNSKSDRFQNKSLMVVGLSEGPWLTSTLIVLNFDFFLTYPQQLKMLLDWFTCSSGAKFLGSKMKSENFQTAM